MGGLRNIPGFLSTGGNFLVDLTLIVEILFYIMLCLGVTAQLRKMYKWHDRFQIPVVVLNLFFIALVMVPSFIAIISSGIGQMPGLVLAHVVFGTLAEGVAIYCLLAGLKILPRKIGVLRYFMWATFVLWTITILLGIGIYISFYTGGDGPGGAATEHAADLGQEHAAEVGDTPTEAPTEVVTEHAEEPVAVQPTLPPDQPVEEHAEATAEIVTEHAEPTVELVEEHAAEPEVAATTEPAATSELVATTEPTATVEALATSELPAPTPELLGPARVGLLTFSDDKVHSDKASLALTGVTPPPDGSVYEAWLEGDNQPPLSLGTLTLDGDAISHTFTDPNGHNLLELYSRMFISVEPASDTAPAPSGVNVFEGQLPVPAQEPVRLTVAVAPDTPENTGYALRALNQAFTMAPEVGFQKDYSIAQNDLAALKIQAEGILNILEGQNAPDFGDRDGSGDVYNPGDGFGLLGSGSGGGYLQATLNQAVAAQAEGVSPELALQAQHTQAAAENSIRLAEQIRDLELQILQAADTAAAADWVNQVTELTQSLTEPDGVDITDPDQGGVRTMYNLAQLMGSIEVFPVSAETVTPPVAPTPELVDEHAGEPGAEHSGN